MSRSRKKAYTGSKAIDPSCRSHGDCPWCEDNREHKTNRRCPPTKYELKAENYDNQVENAEQ
jgi:hypothetical protein